MNPSVKEALERMARYAAKPLPEYKNAINRELCSLSQSVLAYFATYDSAKGVLTMIGWSISAMINCGMIEKPIVYKIEDTGLWGDAVRERKAVITNDYANLVKATKKGYPAGHVHVKRHMNFPIIEGGKVVLVIGVGNKPGEYTQQDAKILEEFMNEIWKTLKTKL